MPTAASSVGKRMFRSPAARARPPPAFAARATFLLDEAFPIAERRYRAAYDLRWERRRRGSSGARHLAVSTVVQMTVETTQETELAAPEDHTCPTRVIDAERVATTRAKGVDGAAAGDVATPFKLLGDPGRVRLCAGLATGGALSVCACTAMRGLGDWRR